MSAAAARIPVAAAIVPLLLAVGAADASTPATGLYGTVMRGPTMPACIAEEPCDEPAAGAVLVFSREGVDVARVHVRTNGAYRVLLRPGWYRVRSPRRIDPRAAHVLRGRMTHVDFSIDTGIR